MDQKLEVIAKSYDKGAEYGGKGINLYDDLPSLITEHPYYPEFVKMMQDGSDSKRKEIKEYLSPEMDMNFIDLGCCLNLMFNDYDKWNSTYHGVDISSETIQLLKEITVERNLRIGSLYCGSVHDTPYEDDYFEVLKIEKVAGMIQYFLVNKG